MGEHVHDEQCVGHIVLALYDGVVAWSCSDGVLRNPWAAAVEEFPDSEVFQARFEAGEQVIAAVMRIVAEQERVEEDG